MSHSFARLHMSDSSIDVTDKFLHIISIFSDYPDIVFSIALSARTEGAHELCACLLEWVGSRATPTPELSHQLGITQQEMGLYMEAVESYHHALILDPMKIESHFNLGIALIELERYEAALNHFRMVVDARPDFLEARHNLCVCLQESGLVEEAEKGFGRILELFPGFDEARFNLACMQLLRGDYAQGLHGYEGRFSKKEPVPERVLSQPRWDGSPLNGRTVLLHSEQGFGDSIMAVRYAPLVARRGGRVILEVQPALVRLLRGVPEIELIVARGDVLPEFDFHIPMMSLPLLFGTTVDAIPREIPYILPEPELIESWRIRLSEDGNFRVGLVWAGRCDHAINRKRSCPVDVLRPFARIPGISLYSLQLGDGNRPVETVNEVFVLNDFSREFRDFADTAACIANLDLVISIDTAVAHLAGALGKPVWVLLPFVPDWRWLLGREDSPWYPTMRLFRQKSRGEWGEVMDTVVSELEELVREGNNGFPGRDNGGVRHYSGASEMDVPQTVAAHPTKIDDYLHRGVSLHEQDRYGEALEVYDRALALWPDSGEAYHNRGNTLLEMGRHEEAIGSYRKALRLIPSFPEGYVTIATALQALRKPYEAMASCCRALEIDPLCAEAHWNLALSLLQVGEYGQGWKEFEWRWKKRGFTSKPRGFLQPMWDGSPLDNKTILIHAEQGFGDTFQFARYLPLVAARGGAVVLECPSAQKSLLAGVPGVSGVFASGEELPEFDLHLPVMSLPLAFETRLDTIPRELPYIVPPLSSIASWAEKFQDTANFRVGLVWAGRKRPDPNRTCPLGNLSPLAGISGITFYSLQLQNEMSSGGTAVAGLEFVDHTAGIVDFSDTAALIAHLDLVISIDTGVAHLAGAMGRETWVLLPYAADWRWMLDRDDSPWYPSMRLFRQETPGDWPGVIERLVKALESRTSDSIRTRQRSLFCNL